MPIAILDPLQRPLKSPVYVPPLMGVLESGKNIANCFPIYCLSSSFGSDICIILPLYVTQILDKIFL